MPPFFSHKNSKAFWVCWLTGMSFLRHVSAAADANWSEYLGGPDRGHFSSLSEITEGNVTRLQIAWEYHTGVAGEKQCNPPGVDGVLYGMTAGKERFPPHSTTRRDILAPKTIIRL